MVQFTRKVTYEYHRISVEPHTFRPGFLNLASNLFDYILPAFSVGSLELRGMLFQHTHVLFRQFNILAKRALPF